MAEVEVDRETGIVKMKKFVTVQDMGLCVNPKTASSQIYGAMIMGIAFSLFEERIMDPKTGDVLECGSRGLQIAEIGRYRRARRGNLRARFAATTRGVIGLGEPPVIGPGATISNAVANALGVRVPVLPITPKRVLDSLKARLA